MLKKKRQGSENNITKPRIALFNFKGTHQNIVAEKYAGNNSRDESYSFPFGDISLKEKYNMKKGIFKFIIEKR